MAQKSKDLVQPDKTTSLSDTGYYNKQEIKNCVDAGITVYIKRTSFLMMRSGTYTFVPRGWRCLSMKIPPEME